MCRVSEALYCLRKQPLSLKIKAKNKRQNGEQMY